MITVSKVYATYLYLEVYTCTWFSLVYLNRSAVRNSEGSKSYSKNLYLARKTKSNRHKKTENHAIFCGISSCFSQVRNRSLQICISKLLHFQYFQNILTFLPHISYFSVAFKTYFNLEFLKQNIHLKLCADISIHQVFVTIPNNPFLIYKTSF